MGVFAIALSLGAAACSNSGMPRATDAERLAFYEAHAGEPVRSFRMFGRLNGWTPLGNSAMVVWTRPACGSCRAASAGSWTREQVRTSN